MDLNERPLLPYVTTVGIESLNSTDSPTQRYVLTLPFEERSEQGCYARN